MYLKLILLVCIFLSTNCSSKRNGRNGRQLDLDAIIEGRLSNHIIGERQSRMLNNLTDKNLTESSITNLSTNDTNLQINKTSKLIDEEESMQKHSSFISHYANDEELSKADDLKKSINLDELIGTLPRVVNEQLYPQSASNIPISYLNPIYPNEDKILASLINQAATNIVSSGQTGDLTAAHSNPPPIYASSADKPLPILNNGGSSNGNSGLSSLFGTNNQNNNKKKPFSSISSSLQEFAERIFPTKVTNKFINRRKQNGQNGANQIDFASFSSECTCVPFYMCRSGYIEQNAAKPYQSTNSPIASTSSMMTNANKNINFDNKKMQGIYDSSDSNLTPAALELIENSSLERLYNNQRLAELANQNNDLQMAATLTHQQLNSYPSLNVQSNQFNSINKLNQQHQLLKENKDNVPQNLPTPLPITISKRTQLNIDDSKNNQENNKNFNESLELPIDERSNDFNQTEGILEAQDIDALTRMFNSPSIQTAPVTTTPNDQQNCGMLRTCCPMLSQREILLAQQSFSILQAQQAAINAAFQQSPNSQPMFAFENFQPGFLATLNQAQSPSQAQPSQNNFIYQPVFNPDLNSQTNGNSLLIGGSNNGKKPILNNPQTSNNQINAQMSNNQMMNNNQMINNQMINNQMNNNQMNNQMINNQMNNNQMNNQMISNQMNNNQMINNQMNNNQMISNQVNKQMINNHMMNQISNPTMINGQISNQFTQFKPPYNKWLQDDKKQYQNLFVQPSLTSYLLTKTPANFQARNPSNDFYVDSSSENDQIISSKKNQCGRRPNLKFNLKLNDNLDYPKGTAQFGDYPWTGALLKRVENSDKSIYVCGATLIEDRFLLTASHCLKSFAAKDFKVRLGEFDVYSENEPYKFVERDIEEIIRHPNYESSTLYNDLALLRIEPINLDDNPHIVPVCRASFGENFAGQKCWLSGFGKSEFSGSYQSVLREVELPVLDHSQCTSLLQKTRLGNDFNLHPGFLCAGGEAGKDGCTGDGGSGLVCSDSNGIWKAVAIASWGINCGNSNVPGVYVNLGAYETWIDNEINKYKNERILKKPNLNDNIQFNHNTLNLPTNGDLLSESSQKYYSIIKNPSTQNLNKKKTDLSSIINERTIKDKSELSI